VRHHRQQVDVVERQHTRVVVARDPVQQVDHHEDGDLIRTDVTEHPPGQPADLR
jgi:hypothetical protein